jgi:hypothetical protein
MAAIKAEAALKPPAKGAPGVDAGQKTCHAKNTARLTITPTTAEVIAAAAR